MMPRQWFRLVPSADRIPRSMTRKEWRQFDRCRRALEKSMCQLVKIERVTEGLSDAMLYGHGVVRL
jgi:hypothetical protein